MAMVASAMLLAAGTAEYFPFHMDIDHYGSSNASVLHPSVPRVAMDTVFECPHPCGLMAFYSSNGTAVNGGIPQEINMTLHLTTLAATFNRTVPLNESRLLDYDFESWNPVWNRNLNISAVQNASRARVRAVHPSWTEDEVEAAAKNDFEDAASGTVSPAQGPTQCRTQSYTSSTTFPFRSFSTHVYLFCWREELLRAAYSLRNPSTLSTRAILHQWPIKPC